MPSALTNKLYRGDEVEVKDFVMDCAKAYEAFVAMREQAYDAQPPETFEPDTFHLEAKNDAMEELERLLRMSTQDIEDIIEQNYQKNIAAAEREREEKNTALSRYEGMLVKVQDWTPPTHDHFALKQYCIEQLELSIKHDCVIFTSWQTEKPTPEEWKGKKIARVRKDIDYHKQQYIKEVKRTKERNVWIRQLRDSL